jgi:hypothetical protein
MMKKACILVGAAFGLTGPALALVHTSLEVKSGFLDIITLYLFPGFLMPPHQFQLWKVAINIAIFLMASVAICLAPVVSWLRYVAVLLVWSVYFGVLFVYNVVFLHASGIVQSIVALAAYMMMTFVLDRCTSAS